ncbi:Drn1 protein [Martiniozyma asiatica (nom. inval.)]|nr:Drn1 protein [Martiniozyma asiatica]
MKVLVLNFTGSLSDLVSLVEKQQVKAGIEICLLLGEITSQDSSSECTIPIYRMGDSIGKAVLGMGVSGSYTIKVNSGSLTIGLKNINKPVDILISDSWPACIAREERMLGDVELDPLMDFKPRYWFCNGAFFERAWGWDEERACRFVSLAKKGNGRWFYAFNIDDKDDLSKLKLTDPPRIKRQLPDENLPDNFKRIHLINESDCFLCLEGKFEPHLVIDQSEDAYIALTKGPLGLSHGKGFIGHGMIVPTFHSSKFPSPLKDSPFWKQQVKYCNQLIDLFTTQKGVPNAKNFGLIFWNINNDDQVHGHIQFLPILISQCEKLEAQIEKQVEFDFKIRSEKRSKFLEHNPTKEAAEIKKLEFLTFKEESSQFWEKIDNHNYIMITKYTPIEGWVRYLASVDGPVDSQFPRKVVALLIEQKEKINWKKCTRGVKSEQIEADKFKESFDKISKNV